MGRNSGILARAARRPHTMHKSPLRLLALAGLVYGSAPAAQDLPFVHFQDFVDSLTAVASIPDPIERDQRVTALWNALRAEERIPFAEGDSVAFLWRGSATTVQVAGDHTGWNPNGNGLTRIAASNVWMRVGTLPEAARVDYKYVLNGSNWILDPNNPHQQWGGLGPNSELRMPAWVFPTETVRDPNVPAGTLSPDLLIASDTLGYTVRYRVFTPAAYDQLNDLPVVYVTDGQDYSEDRLGAVRIVTDNLIHDDRAADPIVVFVDPRSVTNGQNQREDQFVQNPAFAHFIARELVPAIDGAYRTRRHRDARVILGTSLGGVFSLYLGLLQPEVFGRVAAQSAALWVTEHPDWWTGPSLFEMAAAPPSLPMEVYLSTGTIRDGQHDARRMRDILQPRVTRLTYTEVPEGHSWGNWRALIDEVLMALVPGPAVAAEPAAPAGSLGVRAYPNPSAGDVRLEFTLPTAAVASVACFDVQGRVVADVAAAGLAAGTHTRGVRFAAAGTYLCRVMAAGASDTTAVVVTR